ncbi:MFS general substrate transporter [Backusella circina FSU 941]|nr:MFS general substrate transporter [Backusella circina FSU 941]
MSGVISESIHKNGNIERSNSITTENTVRATSDDISVSIEKKEETLNNEQIVEDKIDLKKSNPVWKFWKKDDLKSDPRLFSPMKKRLILLTVAFATSTAPISSTIYLPALVEIQYAFNTTATIVNTSLSVFVFTDAIFPLLWAPFGDLFGRRRIYLISFLINIIGCIGCALSVNVGMFIAFRAISAMGSSSVVSMGAGTLSDIYDAHERGRALSLYALAPLLGPAIAPIIGGYMNESLGWHSIFYFIAGYGAVVWLCILFFLPETWRPQMKLPGSELEKKSTLLGLLKQVNPLGSLRFLRFGNIALCCAFSGINFLMFYLLNATFSRTYTLVYGFSSGTVGLCFLPLAFGGIIGSTVGGRLVDRFYNKACAKTGGEGTPEMRINLKVLSIAMFFQVSAMIAYGWCVYKRVHEAWGLICIFFLAIGLLIPTVTIQTYIVDCFRSSSASVTACINFVRYILGGVGALVATDLQVALGDGVLYTICGGISGSMLIAIVFLKLKQARWQNVRENLKTGL